MYLLMAGSTSILQRQISVVTDGGRDVYLTEADIRCVSQEQLSRQAAQAQQTVCLEHSISLEYQEST